MAGNFKFYRSRAPSLRFMQTNGCLATTSILRERRDLTSVLSEKLEYPHVRELARNPMQLAILLALISTQGASLPTREQHFMTGTLISSEADGLHVTPYGFCLNSFTVDPCPKNLECFNGCRHLARTDLPQEHVTLLRLRDRLKRVTAKIEATPSGSVGRDNQLRHARTRLANLEIALGKDPARDPSPMVRISPAPLGRWGRRSSTRPRTRRRRRLRRTTPAAPGPRGNPPRMREETSTSPPGGRRQSEGLFEHASDITRQPDRRALLEAYEARQKALRDLMSRADKTSRANLSARLAALEEQVRDVTAQRDSLSPCTGR